MLALLAAIAWSGYSYWAEYSELAARKAREMMAPAVGATCKIQVQGSDEMVSGKFVKLNDDWIVLSNGQGRQEWVPRGRVQMMRVVP